MTETRRLYYEDVYKKEFTATVVECREQKKGYAVIVDESAFYPEGGGQPSDVGTLGDAKVTEVHEKDGELLHYTDKALEVGAKVEGKIDWVRRFDLMQQHSGEHMVSGLIHEAYGYDNVGFHMGSDTITVDLNGPLDETQLAEIEQKTNEKIWEDTEVKILYPTAEELENFEPDFVVYNASKAKVENYKELGLNSETAVVFNITSREQVIINTWYGGEMKKGMFSMMNYYLPLKGMASMHCSANTDMDGKNTAIFFGLSGTGKTTLSTDPKRLLIGDDEHGWDDNGVFNFEGGCYAKVIDLDKESEPDIYNAIKRDALLENVTLDENGKIDFADKSVTENTRVSYPIDHIQNIVRPVSSAPAAKNVIFLSADAFGVLPPVSILTPEQTQYYFLSGFTAKLAGTERGITEPTPTFSACFGQAFLELHPTKYAEELVKKMEKSGAKAYLVNTGWNGTGKRISIKDTRGIIDAILSGDINKAPTKTIPHFNFEVPTELPGVDSGILDPRDTYADVADWEAKAQDLAGRFVKNFAKYEGNEAGKALVAAGPQK